MVFEGHQSIQSSLYIGLAALQNYEFSAEAPRGWALDTATSSAPWLFEHRVARTSNWYKALESNLSVPEGSTCT
jgi:hypothetical protein